MPAAASFPSVCRLLAFTPGCKHISRRQDASIRSVSIPPRYAQHQRRGPVNLGAFPSRVIKLMRSSGNFRRRSNSDTAISRARRYKE